MVASKCAGKSIIKKIIFWKLVLIFYVFGRFLYVFGLILVPNETKELIFPRFSAENKTKLHRQNYKRLRQKIEEFTFVAPPIFIVKDSMSYNPIQRYYLPN